MCYLCYLCYWGANPVISATTPDTLLLGIWAAAGRAAITANLRNWRGDTLSDVLALTGEPWTALVQALEQAAVMEVRNVLLFSNDAALVQALHPPFRPPAPDRSERVWYGRTDWVDVGVGGDAAHWRALCALGGRWGGHFRAMLVDDLPKARELWQSQ
jgi:hypothetical protein